MNTSPAIRHPSELIEQRRIIVCVGTGGVGKTTVAAAIAAEAARRGRSALVLTIDPARRLADALGIEGLGNEPIELESRLGDSPGIRGEGRLFALMLDMKGTFDDLVARFARDPAVRERILSNRIYQHVSDALAGSAEYAAMEKVFELHEREEFDLIVVDTPPSQHALDFLDAPQRMIDFLESRIVQLLLHPALAASRFGYRIFHRTAQRVLQLMERVSGVSFLQDISEFLLSFEEMSEGFRVRALRVRGLLLGPQTGFVLVAGASPEAAFSAVEFLDQLEQFQLPMTGLVINRMRVWPAGGSLEEGPDPSGASPPAVLDGEHDLGEEIELLAGALGDRVGSKDRARAAAQAAVEVATGYASMVRLDLRSTAALRERIESQGRFLRCVPEFSEDVHDLAGVLQIGSFLFAESKGRQGDRGYAASQRKPRAR